MSGYSDGVFYAINNRPNPFLVSLVATIRPGVAIDVGSGMGPNAKWLFDQGWKVHVIEQEDLAVAHLLELFPREYVHVGNAMEVSFESTVKFDLLTCNYMLQHLSIDDASILIKKMLDRMSEGAVQVYSLFERPGAISYARLKLIMEASGAKLLASKNWSVEDSNHGPMHHHSIVESAWKCR